MSELSGTRPDVTIVAADALSLAWYREQAARRLGLPPLVGSRDVIEQARVLDQPLRRDRPVFLDPNAMRLLSTSLRYRPCGLVGEVVDGSLAQGRLPDEAERLMETYKTDGGLFAPGPAPVPAIAGSFSAISWHTSS